MDSVPGQNIVLIYHYIYLVKEKVLHCVPFSLVTGSKVLLVQNEGENSLKVNLNSEKDAPTDLTVPKHKTISV